MKPPRSSLVTRSSSTSSVERSPSTSTVTNNSGKSFSARRRTPSSLLSRISRRRFRATLDSINSSIGLLMTLLRKRLRRRKSSGGSRLKRRLS